uniref:Methyl-CpG binding protein-like n=1 Tax=Oryza sativa subsp. japonica TaxID=39947 RepID=Q6YPC1_ORYSJ|nr:methyl-CpG binding protein-like [Oryza sativa Japonica Group]BAD17836.1 methyl-CpG binding protein-like [Oryza sativa Japonica Group]
MTVYVGVVQGCISTFDLLDCSGFLPDQTDWHARISSTFGPAQEISRSPRPGAAGADTRGPPVSGTRAPVHRGPGPPRRSTTGPREPTVRIGPKPIGRPRGGAAGARARHETGSAEPWCWAACGHRRQQPAAPNGGEQPEDGGAHGQRRCTRKGRGAGGGAHRACGPTRQSGRLPAAGRGGGAPRGGSGDGGSAAFREQEPAADGRRDLGKEMKRLGEGRELWCGGKRRPK